MTLKDYIGKRGEKIFSVLITKFCGGKPLFDETFLGEKHEAKDFLVNLVDSTSGDAYFFVQIKATSAGYFGKGSDRKLRVRVTKQDVAKLKKVSAPTYVVGIDVEKECGFMMSITAATSGGISGISTRHRLNCTTLRALWREVD